MQVENLEAPREAEAGAGAGEVNPAQPEGGPAGTAAPPANEVNPAGVAELQAQLEALRSESTAQLAALRAESTIQREAFGNLARSLPGVVPELVKGTTLEEVQASLVTAREAYSRVAVNLAAETPGKKESTGPGPGAGGGARNGQAPNEDRARLSSERGVNMIYQAIAGGKSGNLAR